MSGHSLEMKNSVELWYTSFGQYMVSNGSMASGNYS
jgi:hypothetical protein